MPSSLFVAPRSLGLVVYPAIFSFSNSLSDIGGVNHRNRGSGDVTLFGRDGTGDAGMQNRTGRRDAEGSLTSDAEGTRVAGSAWRRTLLLQDSFWRMEANNLLLDDQQTSTKFLSRTCSTLWMLVGFFLILYMGHVYIWAMIVVIQIFMAKELFNLAAREKSWLGSKSLNWCLFPASLLVINDIAAYTCGRIIGRTPLIKLSPKKTWEGFVGALIVTVSSAFLLADWMGRSPWLTCPRQDLSTGPLSCDPNPSFHSLRSCHALAYGLFASIVAPFGGFFASGFKRAFRIKDFGDSIPGHGGITDRMDCQMLMAVFSYTYYQSFIAPPKLTFVDVLNQALNTLTREQQVELYTSLGKALAFSSLDFCSR
ncbi:hypothetical protein GOP47_0013988 [Adiantum capillus-veneris]|uniref:Phosphatidate cytidylyltransferase n=1 Tax=Adiantum capillus-veneris TaxID=13818 RepID=A0A9D4ZF30_ADICA|nr:hypothetical protein GOP47_0013988 [Adiantum capillus-veneris]